MLLLKQKLASFVIGRSVVYVPGSCRKFNYVRDFMTLRFLQPQLSFADLLPETVSAIIASSTDVALVVDGDDCVRNISCGVPRVAEADFEIWLDSPIKEIVAADGFDDLRSSMAYARNGETLGPCQVSHPLSNGETLAVGYVAYAINAHSDVILLGAERTSIESLRARMTALLQKMEQATEQPQETAPKNHSRPQVDYERPLGKAYGTGRATGHLAALVGSVPLKELVRDTTDLIEKDCIATALQLTGNNRSLAAQVLGLSRQSLYIKMRRHGLIDENLEPDSKLG